jgi:tyrosinase
MAISQGKTSHLFKASKYKDRHCGYPEHMLVPKGTPQGMRFKLFVILTEAQELNESPAVSVCGVQTGTYPDRKPMGFPFDRKNNFGLSLPWFIHQNYKFIEVIVKHKTNKS